MKLPWDFQLAGADALWRQVHERPAENPLVVIPTGAGKSLTMALWVWGMVQAYPHLRILNLTHVKELVGGNAAALLDLWPQAPLGVYSAGLGRREIRQITYAGIASIARQVGRLGKIDFVIVDEAHRISDKDSSHYQKLFKALREKNPNLIIIGFTATDYRMGTGKLTEGKLFDTICFDLSDGPAFVWMLENKYLLRLVPKNPGFQVDETGVKTKAGDFDEKSASQAFRDQDILERAVDEIIAQGQDRQAWLIFNQSIEDAELVADMFRYKGYPVEAVHSQRGDRDEILAAHRAGKLRGITNQNVLTTGYDDPRIDLIGVMRMTKSPSLWVQILGRGTRPLWTPGYDLSTLSGRADAILASAKQNCLVLDFAGNTMRLGPINYPSIPKAKKKGGGSPPVRECPECGTYSHISLRCCEECGYEFPRETKVRQTAGTDDLVLDLNNLPPPPPKQLEVFRVTQMIAAVHPGKAGKPPSVRVDYFCGIRRFSTWLFPAHLGFPRRKTEEWWRLHAKDRRAQPPLPMDAAAVVATFATLRKPEYIKVWLNTKYPEIEAYDFLGTAFELPPELGGPPLALETAYAAEQEESRRDAAATQMAKEMFDDEIPF